MSRFLVIPDAATDRAARWLADNPKWSNGLRRELQERFDLDRHEIAEAVEKARKMQLLRRAHA
ncbi:hypothetical protein [Shinella sp.]|uniref:hypothetical protein n=1 Tax=Shinella sp. TaxID=1870904 RepID=UPI003F6E46C8